MSTGDLKATLYLKRDLIEVEPIAHVVICADCFRVIVHHNCFVSHLKKKWFARLIA